MPAPPEATDPARSPVRVEPATIEDLPGLIELVADLMELQDDFTPDREAHDRGIRLILEEPSRGRIFVLRSDERIIGMVNLLFTISTALGGFVILLEDVIIHPDHRNQGYGTILLQHVIDFGRHKDFKRITLLTDRLGSGTQEFFQRHGFEFSRLIPMRLLLD